MRLRQFIPAAGLLAGAAIIMAAAACGGGSKKADGTLAAQTPEATATSTPSPTATPIPPTPTPTPFAGKVARMKSTKLKIDAPIEELGLTPDNALDTPKKENTDVGWYPEYGRPGWIGNSVFSAHVYYHNIPAPFKDLAKSVEGDTFSIVMEDGTEYQYRVIANERFHRDTIPMGEVIWPTKRPEGKEWITMITCGGQLDSTGQEYISRDVIIAERVTT